jgi:4'-phosphopantetheinyl transferase
MNDFSPPSSDAFGFAGGEVHVWTVPLDGPADRLLPTLSEEERRRADRFHFAHHRQAFMVARGRLREILGGYLRTPPLALQFRLGPVGKPELANGALAFNLSHSHGLAVVAVAASGAVGVDLEKVRPMPDADQLADRFFASREAARLRALPTAVRLASFFRCWTRKEAFIKATGQGLNFPLDRFEVTLAPDEPAQLLHVVGDPAAPGRWSMHHLTPAEGYVAALAIDRRVPPEAVRCYRLAEELQRRPAG